MRPFLLSMCFVSDFTCGCGKTQPPTIAGKSVDHWLEHLRDSDAKERRTAVFKLEAAGTSDPAVLTALIGMLKDSDPTVRCEAIVAVAKWGSAANEAVPILMQMQQEDESLEVQGYATKALEKLSNKM
jgi:hypothetical protein